EAPSYTASARFLTQGGRTTPNVGLANQLGVNIAAGAVDASQTPDFYVELLTSRPVLERTARANYAAPAASDSQTLAKVFGSEALAIAALRRNIVPTFGLKTGIVSFSVTAPSPDLAQQVA